MSTKVESTVTRDDSKAGGNMSSSKEDRVVLRNVNDLQGILAGYRTGWGGDTKHGTTSGSQPDFSRKGLLA